MTRSSAPHAAHRVVLDSNVWIDILVFDDPATRPIRAALERGTLAAVIDGRCLNELELVLDYPQFRERAIDKAEALATVARLTSRVEPPPVDADAPPLPKCKDRDDQKFLELARAAQADWLVSKDRALLKLAKRTARDFGFRIAQPAPFTEACALDAASALPTTPA
ncbi:putative toxin-antitoxin system toxin component, PIN family [Burkholderia ambifaria]|uniref:putative toxin-antitoxin system toxin component, PIN family n=1 Tax=Burkholderia TaxID=32008 RepID=UPI000D0048D5|nr:putative toxin-antitoxin system toxin component, PIN family [Burkholderia ambifaria]MDP9582671.1 putative PIN family toxin of toxin-antitoxin system [Burkholderia contaminans]MBR8186688.1 putative toxin-antitoxin system toxin component, PIN family [Burkholderia ambifaria]MBR8346205.1 putative toxin-antitoxin system toxin component, PIN family [Burkholderia ambifaria]PRG10047.1 putative toxin-antitoxin system toxin component, PIN family [Burkholderia ambifaria]UEP20477.1 putative toxin-antit